MSRNIAEVSATLRKPTDAEMLDYLQKESGNFNPRILQEVLTFTAVNNLPDSFFFMLTEFRGKVDPDCIYDDRDTNIKMPLLSSVAVRGHVRIVEILCSDGVCRIDPNKFDEMGLTPLHYALSNENSPIRNQMCAFILGLEDSDPDRLTASGRASARTVALSDSDPVLHAIFGKPKNLVIINLAQRGDFDGLLKLASSLASNSNSAASGYIAAPSSPVAGASGGSAVAATYNSPDVCQSPALIRSRLRKSDPTTPVISRTPSRGLLEVVDAAAANQKAGNEKVAENEQVAQNERPVPLAPASQKSSSQSISSSVPATSPNKSGVFASVFDAIRRCCQGKEKAD